MPADEKEIKLKVGLTDAATPQFKEIVNTIREQAEALKKATEEGNKSHLEAIKEAFGRGSKIEEITKLAKGAGAIIGLTEIGKQLDEFANKARDIDKLSRDIDSDWMEVGLKIGESIPIVGEFITAGRALNELITHEAERVEQINLISEATNKFVDDKLAALREQHNVYLGIEKSVRAIADHTARIGLHGSAATFLAAKQAGDTAQEDIKEELKNKVYDLQHGERDQKIKDARKRADAIQKAAMESEPGLVDTIASLNRLDPGGAGTQHRKQPKQLTKAETDFREAQKLRDFAYKEEVDRNKEIDELKTRYGGKAVKQAQDAAKVLEVVRKEDSDATLKEVTEINSRIAHARATAESDALKATGQVHAAELVMLRENLREQNEAVNQALKDRKKLIQQKGESGELKPEDVNSQLALADSQARREKAANQAEFAGGSQRADVSEVERRARMLESISQAQVASLNDQVAAGDKAAEVERDRLKIAEEFLKRKRELDDLIFKATPEEKKQLEAEKEKLEAAEKAAQAHRLNMGIESAAAEALRESASGGNRQAKIALEQFEIQKKFKQQRQELQGLLNDPNASAEQRAQAQAVLGGLDTSEKVAMNKAGLQGIKFEPFAHAENNQGGGITGLTGKAQFEAMSRGLGDPHLKEEQKQNQTLKEILTAIEQQSPGGIAGAGPLGPGPKGSPSNHGNLGFPATAFHPSDHGGMPFHPNAAKPANGGDTQLLTAMNQMVALLKELLHESRREVDIF